MGVAGVNPQDICPLCCKPYREHGRRCSEFIFDCGQLRRCLRRRYHDGRCEFVRPLARDIAVMRSEDDRSTTKRTSESSTWTTH